MPAMPDLETRPAIGVVVLSQGNRPDELRRCVNSVLGQHRAADVVCVGNGWTPTGLDPAVRTVALPENVGSPAGRNVGAAEVAGELIFFLDDDAWLDAPDVLDGVVALFASRPRLGAVQLKVVGDDGSTMRRWVPRARVGDPERSGPAFALAEGVTIVRRAAFDEIGGWYGGFFFGHEGVDLAWRLWDAGWELHYAGDLAVRHPSTLATRHASFFRLNARNRVWLARRNLPVPVLALYLLVWSTLTSARLLRDPAALRTWWRGFVEGWRTYPGRRQPMRWRTVAHLARLGQPPVV
jgi:GT2 family glycosyltransferase